MDVLVGRQPIFDLDGNTYAYELLFRGGFNGLFKNMDEIATNEVIHNTLFSIGFEQLTKNKPAFINFSRSFLNKRIPFLLPKEKVVIELLEHVEPDDHTLEICKELKENGYITALDDFVFHTDSFYKLFEYIDIIKIDFSITDKHQRNELVTKLKGFSLKLLAEKVETRDQYEEAKRLGCVYFQGFYFKKPDIVLGKEIPSNHMNNISIIREISVQNFNFSILEKLIRKDPSLTFKLLKFINSAAIGVRKEITSLKQALVMIGIKELRKWMYLLLIRDMNKKQSSEILATSIIRAYFCEAVSKKTQLNERSEECFILGMFSLIDVLTGLEMVSVVDSLPLQNDVVSALLGEQNSFKYLIDLIVAFENGDWEAFEAPLNHFQITETYISKVYLKAITWAHDLDL